MGIIFVTVVAAGELIGVLPGLGESVTTLVMVVMPLGLADVGELLADGALVGLGGVAVVDDDAGIAELMLEIVLERVPGGIEVVEKPLLVCCRLCAAVDGAVPAAAVVLNGLDKAETRTSRAAKPG